MAGRRRPGRLIRASLLPPLVTRATSGVGAPQAGGLRRRVLLAEAIAELSHRALVAEQPDDLLAEALRTAVDVTGADYGTAVRRLPDGRLRIAEELGPDPLPAGTVLPVAPERSYLLRVIETRKPVVSKDLGCDPRLTPPSLLLARGVRCGVAVPVLGAQSVLGVLAVHSRHQKAFDREDVATVSAFASVAATAWEQLAAREQLRFQALHDPLTGLPNRDLFLDRLEQAISRRPPEDSPHDCPRVGVMLVDLDDFKRVNDTLGHAAGDEVLRRSAQRFVGQLRPQDTVARLGGDEFAVLCDELPDSDTAVRLGHRLQQALSIPMDVETSSLSVTASIGVTWSCRTTEKPTASVMLDEADTALYQAKAHGGGLHVFDEPLQRTTRRRRELERALDGAAERGELELTYQPVRRSGDLRAIGVEVLLRWRHPARGLLLPSAFLPLAEQTGRVVALGEWVLRESCRDVAAWQSGQPDGSTPVWLAVNVSPRQLDDPGLADVVAEVLDKTGIAPGSLVLELTESAVMDVEQHRQALGRLRDAGARLFLDDFGTGYSSLTNLTQLPIAAVKIDRSFVTRLDDPRNAAVAASVISLADQLGMLVIAEGVETDSQLRSLRSMGCPAVQGFLLDRPQAHPRLEPSELARSR